MATFENEIMVDIDIFVFYNFPTMIKCIFMTQKMQFQSYSGQEQLYVDYLRPTTQMLQISSKIKSECGNRKPKQANKHVNYFI